MTLQTQAVIFDLDVHLTRCYLMMNGIAKKETQ